MPTSAAGNKLSPPPCWSGQCQGVRGFTLIELLVVICLIAIASAGVSLALRDSADGALERDAQRLIAVLESARAQARANGSPVVWRAQGHGFVLVGLPRSQALQTWLSEHTRVEPGSALVLGPEPLLPPQSITLLSAQKPGLQLHIGSDGLRPFAVTRQGAGGLAP